MSKLWNKKLAAIFTGASMLAAVEFINIYVPDKVNDKFIFRFSQLIEKIGSKIVSNENGCSVYLVISLN